MSIDNNLDVNFASEGGDGGAGKKKGKKKKKKAGTA